MAMSTIQVFEWSASSLGSAPEAGGDFAREAFESGVRWLESKGVVVERRNVREDRGALDANPTVKGAFEAQGPDCLPMVVVDGTIVSVGGYPTRIELMESAGAATGSDPEFLGDLAVETAGLGAAIAANAFEDVRLRCERLRVLGIRNDDLNRAVKSAAATASGLLRGDMLTRVEQYLAFGPQGKPPKARCACADKV